MANNSTLPLDYDKTKHETANNLYDLIHVTNKAAILAAQAAAVLTLRTNSIDRH